MRADQVECSRSLVRMDAVDMTTYRTVDERFCVIVGRGVVVVITVGVVVVGHVREEEDVANKRLEEHSADRS